MSLVLASTLLACGPCFAGMLEDAEKPFSVIAPSAWLMMFFIAGIALWWPFRNMRLGAWGNLLLCSAALALSFFLMRFTHLWRVFAFFPIFLLCHLAIGSFLSRNDNRRQPRPKDTLASRVVHWSVSLTVSLAITAVAL